MGKKEKIPYPATKKCPYTSFMPKKKWKQFLAKATLELAGKYLQPEGTNIVGNQLAKNQNVMYCDLSQNAIGDRGATMLAQFLKTNIVMQKLNLSCNEIGNIGAIALASAFVPYANPGGPPGQWNRCVDELILSGNKIGNDGFQALCMAAACQPELHTIDVTYNEIKGFGCKSLYRTMERNKFCRFLLGHNEIGDEGVTHYCQAMKRFGGEGVGYINLWCNGISKGGGEALGDMICDNTFVQRLNVSWNTLGVPGVQEFVKRILPPATNVLQELNLSHNCLGKEGADEVAKLIAADFPLLARIDVSVNEISDHGGEKLFHAVAKSQSLRQFLANDNDFEGRTAEAVCDALKGNKQLKVIELSKCKKFLSEHINLMNRAKEEVEEENRKERERLAAEEAARTGEKVQLQTKQDKAANSIILKLPSPIMDDAVTNFLEKVVEFVKNQKAQAEEKAAKGKKKGKGK